MARPHRLIALLLALVSFSALAINCTQYATQGTVYGFLSGYSSSKEAACEVRRAYVETQMAGYVAVKWTNAGTWEGGTACNLNMNYASGAQAGQTYVVYTYSYVSRTGDYCSQEACPTALTQFEATMTAVFENISQAAASSLMRSAQLGKLATCSVDGCVIKRPTVICGGRDGVWHCEAPNGQPVPAPANCTGMGTGYFDSGTFSSFTPEASVPGGTVTTTATNAPPGPGMCPGQVNGLTVYMPCTSTVGGTVTSSVTSTASGTVSMTVDSTTVCANGVCTTTVAGGTATQSVTSQGGSVVTTTVPIGSSTSVVTEDAFCKANPKDPACVNSDKNRVGGSCETFTCDGDAALCAVAKATQDQKCLLEKTSAESALYATAAAASGSGLTSETFGISGASFDQTNLLSAGSGMTDRTITIAAAGWSKTITLPFSAINPYLAYFGQLLVSVSMLLAMRIVFRG